MMVRLAVVTCAVSIGLFAFLAISTPHVSTMWASWAYTAVLVVLLGAVVAAILCGESSKRYWRGFALFAAAYFTCNWLYLDSWWVTGYLPDEHSQQTSQILPPTYILAWMYDHCGGEEMWTGGGTRVPAMFMIRADRAAVPDHMDISAFDAFMGGGQAVFTVLFGLVGGFLCTCFFREETSDVTTAR